MITTQYMTSFTPEEMKLMVEQGAAKDARIAELEQQVAAAQERERGLVHTLEVIASYDNGGKPGICPYGCDTPHIAQTALAAAQQEGSDG